MAIRTQLREFNPAARASASEAICRCVENEKAWRETELVCAFVPLPSEPAIVPLWEVDSARAFCFPRVRGEALELVRIDDRALLKDATWRLDDDALRDLPLVSVAEVDLILVPGLAFTRAGLRLGRGRGFYDRLLTQSSACKLGVCFDLQIVAELPLEAHDQRVERVITESGVA